MIEFHKINSVGIEGTPTVDRIIERYININIQKERGLYSEIDNEQLKLFLEIRAGWHITRYYNPFYNGDDNYKLVAKWGYYWTLNAHTLRPIIGAPTDAQVFQVNQLLERKQVFYNQAITELVNLMLQVTQ